VLFVPSITQYPQTAVYSGCSTCRGP